MEMITIECYHSHVLIKIADKETRIDRPPSISPSQWEAEWKKRR